MRKACFSVIMWICTTVVCLGLAESGIRLFARVPAASLHTASAENSEGIPGVFEPNQRVLIAPIPQLRHGVSINSSGYRGPEASIDKSSSVVRILCLGDSFTFGEFVDDSETFPYQLQELYKRNGDSAEVINGGVHGTTIVDQYEFLKKSMALHPAIVILTFSENDIQDMLAPKPMYVKLKENRALKAAVYVRPIYEVIRNTATFNFMLKMKGRYENWRMAESLNVTAGHREDMREDAWKAYKKVLSEFSEYLEREDVGMVFAIYPSHLRWSDERVVQDQEFEKRLQRIEETARGLKIPTVNLLGALQQGGSRVENLYLLPHDGHPSPAGYAIVARRLFEFTNEVYRDRMHRG